MPSNTYGASGSGNEMKLTNNLVKLWKWVLLAHAAAIGILVQFWYWKMIVFALITVPDFHYQKRSLLLVSLLFNVLMFYVVLLYEMEENSKDKTTFLSQVDIFVLR